VKVFLAGASGAIGRLIIPQLVRRDHHVIAATRTTSKMDGLRTAAVAQSQAFSGDLRAQTYARMFSGRSAGNLVRTVTPRTCFLRITATVPFSSAVMPFF
jgi:nucleoside-diphosphate-sugar epimerase